jgi:hypothetical protein
MNDLSDAIFALGPHIRYVAYGSGQSIELSQHEGVLDASDAASDFFEELLVNPTLLTIARQRGNLDCGGLRHLIVGYGNFNQVILETHEGHLRMRRTRSRPRSGGCPGRRHARTSQLINHRPDNP